MCCLLPRLLGILIEALARGPHGNPGLEKLAVAKRVTSSRTDAWVLT